MGGDQGRQVVDLSRTWEVGCSREDFQALEAEESFHAIVALARVLNLTKYAQVSITCLAGSASPLAQRQSLNSMFLTCAALHEARQNVLPFVGKHFNSWPAYSEGLGAWQGDLTVKDFLRLHCEPLRNSVVSHVDIQGVAARVPRLTDEWVRFMSGRGRRKGFYYYDVADVIALQVLVPGGQSQDEVNARLSAVTKDAARIAGEFIDGADRLIYTFVLQSTFEWRQLADSTEPPCMEDAAR